MCCAASEPEFALKRMQIGNGRKSRPFIWKRKWRLKVRAASLPPINAVLSSDGNTITLHSPENCDRAFVTISGNGTYLTEMVNFTDQTATLDVSDLDCGVYLITVEYENGTIYTGHIEFLKI